MLNIAIYTKSQEFDKPYNSYMCTNKELYKSEHNKLL